MYNRCYLLAACLRNKLTYFPRIRRVRNWGFDNSKDSATSGDTTDYKGSTTVDYSKHYSRLGICPPPRKNRSQRLKVKGKRNHPPQWPSRSPDVSHPPDRQHLHVATPVSGASQAPGQNLPEHTAANLRTLSNLLIQKIVCMFNMGLVPII